MAVTVIKSNGHIYTKSGVNEAYCIHDVEIGTVRCNDCYNDYMDNDMDIDEEE